MKLSGKLAETGLKSFIEERFMIDGYNIPKIWVVVLASEKVFFFRKPDYHLEKIGAATPKQKSSQKKPQSLSGGDRDPQLRVRDTALKQGEDVFMKSLAEFLDRAAIERAYDRLILAAAPGTLRILRPLLSRNVSIHLNATLDKDLMHLDETQLYDHLNNIFWV